MIIERLVHSCFLVHAGEQKVLFDPAMDFYNAFWMSGCNRPLPTPFLQEVAAVFISHSHADHFHLPTLFMADRSLPIYLPAGDLDSAWSMHEELSKYGFQHVIHLQPWESVTISNLTVTAVPAPDSIEGIPQTSYLTESSDVGFLNAVDTLEKEEIFRRVRDEYRVDILSLPVNCSFNVLNIRNQMSPATALMTVETIRPAVFLPTGVNLCEEKTLAPVDVPMFPHDVSLEKTKAFQAAVPEGTRLVPLPDHHVLTYEVIEGTVHCTVTFQEEKVPDSEAVQSRTRGRILSNLLDVFYRDEHYFGYNQYPPFAVWRERIVGCLDDLLRLGVDPREELAALVARIPISYISAPLLRYFRKSVAALSVSEEALATELVAESLLCLDGDMSERDYIRSLYRLLIRKTEGQGVAAAVARLEYQKFLQMTHLQNRPPFPAGIGKEAAETMLMRQLDNDMKACAFLYPRWNPIYTPIRLSAQTLHVYAGKPIQEGGREGPEVLYVPAFQRKENGALKLNLLPLGARESELALVLLEDEGRSSLDELCARTCFEKSEAARFFEKVLLFEAFAFDFHWYPGTGYRWDVDIEGKSI